MANSTKKNATGKEVANMNTATGIETYTKENVPQLIESLKAQLDELKKVRKMCLLTSVHRWQWSFSKH